MTCWKRFFCYLLCLLIKPLVIASIEDHSESGEFVSTPLTAKNYKQILQDNKYVFVKFYTDWCVFSKRIYDIWEHVGEIFQEQSDILITEMDCGVHKQVCQSFNVREYPKLIMFRNGKRFERYIGPRTSNDIISYIHRFISIRKLKDV